MTSQRAMLAVAAAGICIAVSGFVLYDTGLLGIYHTINSSGGQVISWDTARGTKLSVMVFEGTVKSTEIKHVYEPPEIISSEEYEKEIKEASDIHMNITGERLHPGIYEPPVLPNGDYLIRSDRDVPYNYLTIQVTEWFKDSTGQYADQVVIRDSIPGAAGKIDGKPAWFEKHYAVDYSIGQKAIFFVEYLEGELSTDGATQVFRYDDNGMVYLPYFADFEDPLDADELRAEIRANS